MRFVFAATLLILSGSFALAQRQSQEQREKLCDAASELTVGHDAEVIIQHVTLSGKWGRNESTVYLPDKEIVDGAVVFSHSAIHDDSGTTIDLTPFALTLAHAGAAVIVPERTLIWLPTELSMNREAPVVVCARRWLIGHTKVFNDGQGLIKMVNDKNVVVREGYAYVGPLLCTPAVTSDCDYHSRYCVLKQDCPFYETWVPVGETDGGDNTRSIISDGGLRVAQTLQKHLGLSPIKTLAIAQSSSGS